MQDKERCKACGIIKQCNKCAAPSDTCWDTHYEGSCGDTVCNNEKCEQYGN